MGKLKLYDSKKMKLAQKNGKELVGKLVLPKKSVIDTGPSRAKYKQHVDDKTYMEHLDTVIKIKSD